LVTLPIAAPRERKSGTAWGEKRTLHHGGIVEALAFSPDSKALASGSCFGRPQSLRLLDIETGRPRAILMTKDGGPSSLKYTPDGKTLAAARADKVYLWDVEERKKRSTLEGVGELAPRLDISRDGKRLVSSEGAEGIKLWNLATGKVVGAFRDETKLFHGVAFSPDGKLIAVGVRHPPVVTDQGHVLLLDGETARLRHKIPSRGGEVIAVAFSPDGALLAAGGLTNGDQGHPVGELGVWDVKTLKERWSLRGHEGEIRAVVFSPDGKLLATGADDDSVRLWETGAGRLLATLPARLGGVKCLAFSPDGRLLAAGGDNGTVRVWSRGRKD
jgi:WD40 repeat protein